LATATQSADEAGKFVARTVQMGLSHGELSTILEGLQLGEMVVTAGSSCCAPNCCVMPHPEGKQPRLFLACLIFLDNVVVFLCSRLRAEEFHRIVSLESPC
jgi:hypothetical protein